MRLAAVLALLAFLPPGNPDPRIGTWTLVSAQSVLDPPNTLSIVPVPKGVHILMSGEVHLDLTARTDGHGSAVSGNPAFNGIELHRSGKRQTVVKELQNGALVATVREEMSNDGKELTVRTVRGGHPDQVTVWTRSAGTPGAGNSIDGNWTEDLGKSRMREGLLLKITPDGSDGVRFSGDEGNFTGRFDGKQYDVQNGRNDTVQLALVDPHTVDEAYRRDNQITQRDRWVVSPDGGRLTLTRKGTLETGQRLSETLAFQKQ